MKQEHETQARRRSLLIVAGESSGDGYGAALVRELLQQEPRLRVAGLGGPRMAAAGVELLQDLPAPAVIGVGGGLNNLGGLVRAYRKLTHRLSVEPPDAVVLIEFPEFNLMVARHAKRVGVPVIYYVSPQVWAWRRGRLKKIAKYVRKMLCLFQFEKEMYRRAGIDVTLVGHPLLDTMAEKLEVTDRPAVRRSLGLPETGTLIGLLPGSRRKEIEYVLPVLLESAEIMQRRMKDLTFVTVWAEGLDPGQFSQIAAGYRVESRTVSGRAHDVMLASDLLLVCSGTATLEAGLLGTPMVVTYKADILSHVIFGPLISPGNYALVNIAAGKQVVPELYMIDATPKRISTAALDMLCNRLDETRRNLAVVREKLGSPGASARAADEILKVIQPVGR